MATTKSNGFLSKEYAENPYQFEYEEVQCIGRGNFGKNHGLWRLKSFRCCLLG